MADATDLKSVGRKAVGVQVPSPAPLEIEASAERSGLFSFLSNLPVRLEHAHAMMCAHGGMAELVYCSGLENRRAATPFRGFESLSLRQIV